MDKTDVELRELKRKSEEELREIEFSNSSEDCDVFKSEWQPPEWTCDECPSRFECEFVYDTYNTNGDCLGGK